MSRNLDCAKITSADIRPDRTDLDSIRVFDPVPQHPVDRRGVNVLSDCLINQGQAIVPDGVLIQDERFCCFISHQPRAICHQKALHKPTCLTNILLYFDG